MSIYKSPILKYKIGFHNHLANSFVHGVGSRNDSKIKQATLLVLLVAQLPLRQLPLQSTARAASGLLVDTNITLHRPKRLISAHCGDLLGSGDVITLGAGVAPGVITVFGLEICAAVGASFVAFLVVATFRLAPSTGIARAKV